MEISELIKTRMEELNLKQKEVAEAVGVSEGTVSRWKSGEINSLRQSRIVSLANILQIDPIDLVRACPQNARPKIKDNESDEIALSISCNPELKHLFKLTENLKKEDLLVLISVVERFK
ncbi:helix-turn-helix domain-containing protein [Cloacibacillus evryensis]|uniref:helix-turn-helix domain-containing protein n=1 Tax=Cloacibacillus evryensis TaxID=508460 RepID=UPI0005511E7C|nr:helix-turn-helix transcriptional regulator [Cloacibacillus evryensis]